MRYRKSLKLRWAFFLAWDNSALIDFHLIVLQAQQPRILQAGSVWQMAEGLYPDLNI